MLKFIITKIKQYFCSNHHLSNHHLNQNLSTYLSSFQSIHPSVLKHQQTVVNASTHSLVSATGYNNSHAVHATIHKPFMQQFINHLCNNSYTIHATNHIPFMQQIIHNSQSNSCLWVILDRSESNRTTHPWLFLLDDLEFPDRVQWGRNVG